jgi:NTP pyrophosphatase (non-canonical NTP hydrolase)
MQQAQRKAAELMGECGLTASTQVRCLDLISEVGELAKEVLKATDYGNIQEPVHNTRLEEELGDCVFSLLALAEAMGLDAEAALESALGKYRSRWLQQGEIGSGR